MRLRGSGLRLSQFRLMSTKKKTRPAATVLPLRGADSNKRHKINTSGGLGGDSSPSAPSTITGDGVHVPHPRQPQSLNVHDNLYITALLDAFLTLGMASEAELIFNRYRRDGHQFSVSVYNKLLQCWVKKGSYVRATMLFESMRRAKVECNAQSYATMLILHTRRKNWEATKEIISLMESKGYLLKHVFQTTQLSKSEATDMLKAMTQFHVSPETLPHDVGPYPPVVRTLYEKWAMEAEERKQGGNEEEEWRKVVEGEEADWGDRLTVCSPSLKPFTATELKDRLRRQLQIEQQGYLNVPSIASVCKSDNPEEEALKESTHQLMRQWRRDLVSALKKDTEDFWTVVKHLPAVGSKFFGPKQFPFLALLPAEVWADIVVEEVVVHILGQQQGLPVTYLCRLICDSAWHKYVVAQKKERGIVEKTSQLYHQFMSHLTGPSSHHLPYRELWQDMDDSLASAGSLSVDIPKWSFTVNSYVGTGLLSRLMDTAKLSLDHTSNGDGEAAFYHSYETGDNGWLVGHIKAHQKLFKLFKKYYVKHESTNFRMAAELSPMLIPPRPWSQVNEGGYFVTPVSIMRTIADVYQHHSLLQQAPNLNAVFDSLNVLGTCPWRINTRILDLVTEVFNNGGSEELGVPVRDPVFPVELESQEPSRRKQSQMKKLQNECYSLWMDMLYRLSLANYFRNELFWMPHNMDFRGRVYPVPPHLSHLTSDVGRAMLQFGAGYPLGERGLDWLKIHLVNLHGHMKKASLEKRVKYADDMMHHIMDSADNPMEGGKWWQSGDDPWQVLACCMEITDAIRSGDPPNFISHIPVHQDGSCNGLQHYAALGRDKMGAKQVNLTPGDTPQDPYAGVAEMVEQQRQKDAAEGHKIALKLEGKINRKVVKQTVMTVVYGVTWVGGRLQIAKQLRGNIPDDDLWDCSAYIVGEVFRALRQSFANARGIQDWFSACARKVSLANRPMEWVTPLGLPVVQPYHKHYPKSVLTQLQTLNMRVTWNSAYPPDTRKQKNAMPPNFVHSLDSTHMMLTALHTHRAGISFVAVHDSYWTHACFVDTMNKICRQQFVTLHNEPILSDLASFLEQKFGNLTYKDNTLKKNRIQKCKFRDPFPTIGDLDLNQVLDSTYFFS